MLTTWSGYLFWVTCTEIAFIPDVSYLSDLSNASILNVYSLSDHSPRSGHARIRTVRIVRSETDDPIRMVLCGRSETDRLKQTILNGRSEMDDSETPPPPYPLSISSSLSISCSVMRTTSRRRARQGGRGSYPGRRRHAARLQLPRLMRRVALIPHCTPSPEGTPPPSSKA